MARSKGNGVIKRIVGTLLVSGAMALAVARALSIGVQYEGVAHPGLAHAFYYGDIVGLLGEEPLFVAWSDPTVSWAAPFAFVITAALVFMVTSPHKSGLNEDNETAHGDARLADDKEKGDLLDSRNACNNFKYTEHSGVVFEPWNDKTKMQSYAKNLNSVTFGISGLGKTFNLVTPMLMQAVGNLLEPLPSGLPALVGRVKSKVLPSRRMSPEESAKEYQGSKRSLKHVCRKAAEKGVGGGYDVFVTDPKGDCLRDCGSMFEAAGYDIAVMNMLDLKDSCGINPFAYVSTRPNDIMDVSEAEFELDVFDGTRYEITPEQEVSGSDGEGLNWSVTNHTETLTDSTPRDGVDLDDIEGYRRKLTAGTAGGHMPVREIVEAARGLNLCELAASASKDTKPGSNAGSDLSEGVSAVMADYTFQRSFGVMHFHSVNTKEKEPGEIPCTIRFDRRLVVDAIVGNGNMYDVKLDERTDQYVVEIEARMYMGDTCDVAIAYHVCQQTVPDGVALQKTVETMVSNLGTQPGENSNQDPFWEDTKKLAFMSFASYLFEAYESEHRNIPEMMRLLGMALPEGGDLEAPSPLSRLMDMWQRGEKWGRIDGGSDTPNPFEGRQGAGTERVVRKKEYGWVTLPDTLPHSRHLSMALHCYYAFTQAPPETVQSIVATCQAALVNLNTPEIKEVLRKDELELDRLGEPGQRKAVFCIVSDTPSPYDFLTAMVAQIAIDSGQERAYRKYDGKLPRHVRFILDEVANIGKIPVLLRALAVVRSRNMSVHMFLQSMAQLQQVYGEKEAEVILDNCSVWNFLGAQTGGTLEMISKKIGEETVYSRVLNRSFSGNSIMTNSASESLTGSARKVKSESQLQQMSTDEMLCFIYNHLPIQDTKIQTAKHPLYPYVSPQFPRKIYQPPSVFDERFDFSEYRERKAASPKGGHDGNGD